MRRPRDLAEAERSESGVVLHQLHPRLQLQHRAPERARHRLGLRHDPAQEPAPPVAGPHGKLAEVDGSSRVAQVSAADERPVLPERHERLLRRLRAKSRSGHSQQGGRRVDPSVHIGEAFREKRVKRLPILDRAAAERHLPCFISGQVPRGARPRGRVGAEPPPRSGQWNLAKSTRIWIIPPGCRAPPALSRGEGRTACRSTQSGRDYAARASAPSRRITPWRCPAPCRPRPRRGPARRGRA
jgi:hypothetical protein